MTPLFFVGLGGFVGAIARYLFSGLLKTDAFPFGTLLVNVLGCFAIGALMTLVVEREMFSAHLRLLLVTGFLGSLTTFSTFGFETVELLRRDEVPLALENVLANAFLGLAAVWLGRLAVRLLWA